MDFDIHKVKSVLEVFCEADAQEHINNGWTLLNVCGVSDGETSDRCYILGSYEPPKPQEHNSKLQEFLNKFPNV